MFDIDPLEYAFEHVQSGLALVDGEGVVTRANKAGAGLVGRTVEELTGTNFAAIMHPDDLAVAFAEQDASQSTGFGGPVQVRISRPDGSWVWIRGIGTLLPTEPPVSLVMFEDVTEERAVHERLVAAEAASARRAAQQTAVAQLGREALSGASLGELAESASKLVVSALEAPFAGVLLADHEDPEGDLLLVGAAGVLSDWVGHYRHPRDQAVQGTLGQREPTVVTDLAVDPGEGGRRLLVEAGIKAVAATPIVPRNAPAGMFITGRDEPGGFDEEIITFVETVANVLATALDSHQAVDDLRFNALHDDLTGLPNRALLLDRLELGLEQSGPTDCDVAVLVCDLDRFKVINDGMGHAAGDEVLRMVAARLRQIVRAGDTVGRFGGDEFVIVCPEIADINEVVDIAERLAAAFKEPMEVFDAELVATASIGIAIGHDTGPEPAAGLLRDADAAMYRAKARGRARYELFDDEMRAWASERLRIETELRHAIAHDELVLHYQPVLAIDSREMVGLEALVRWQHPTRGLLPPLEFLGVAEDAGILPELGRWTFSEAVRQTGEWVARGDWGDRWTAVNLSPQDVNDPQLVEKIQAIITEFGVDASHMRVELTEEALIEDSVQVGEVLDDLRECGVGISVDDFGTGYSSLSYLRRLPVDCLKVDRTFVSGLGERSDDAVIASAIISLAAALGLDVVAEGVETAEQLDVLRRIGCKRVQGYLFARPMPADQVVAWLA